MGGPGGAGSLSHGNTSKCQEESQKMDWISSILLKQVCVCTHLAVSKITADSVFSHEIKRRLLLGRKAMTNLDIVLQNRDITLPSKVHLVKAMIFPVVMYRWTIKKAERQRIDVFQLWYGEDS